MAALNLANAAIPPFIAMISDAALLEAKDTLSTLQINLGRLCNLSCKHCHLESGPERKEVMSEPVLNACLQLLRKENFVTADITGGAPELHPRFRDFVSEARPFCRRMIVRTNLVLLLEPGYDDLPVFFRDNQLEVVCSLPHYTAQGMNRMRGDGVLAASIAALQKLNLLGYGLENGFVLNLVFNPGGAFLPPAQAALEKEYKLALRRDFGIEFNQLLTLTNNPLGRFGAFLERSGNLDDYLGKLHQAFNPMTLEGMMCRDQVSVAYDGRLYDCDFNQAAELPIDGGATIFDRLKPGLRKILEKRPIRFGQHCYACTAGQGSSCGGAIKTS
ncbi:MAG: arsenosugar biosynthesis radical SAM protein ArsS [Synergistaceae bacterium]|jgi:radical SAM/Cys-rich protein|nr:arsenosugar biosynthesis radical SAM protein ArsS [Synergistaceae bacterium]